MSYRSKAFVSIAGILLIICCAAIAGVLLYSSGSNSSATVGEAAVQRLRLLPVALLKLRELRTCRGQIRSCSSMTESLARSNGCS